MTIQNQTFQTELELLLNKYSIHSKYNLSDVVLAEYIVNMLKPLHIIDNTEKYYKNNQTNMLN